ncbi:hypothetical protein [Paenarthrobacter sp. CM16]|uniref:hypothetical protein n=1 Tax=Paenarthrobacter sp. CM16 TaxID=2738447 RepID=UPI001556CF2F|nr:hypothetical protein [Paenarthrobacter sp. CM16]
MAMDDDALAHFDLSHARAKFVDVIQKCERVAALGNPRGRGGPPPTDPVITLDCQGEQALEALDVVCSSAE